MCGNRPFDPIREAFAEHCSSATILGPLRSGRWIQLTLGIGFFVPEADFLQLQERANKTGRIQFLAVEDDGRPVHGTREQLLANPKIKGGIAWIVPAG